MKLIFITAALAQVASLSSAASVESGKEFWESWTSQIDPFNVTIPKITQTTSIDPFQECVDYIPDSSLITINPKEWPTIWDTATTNGMNESAEFKALKGSIDWTKAPNIQVRQKDANGNLIMTGYDQNSDPDCWWSASTCVHPKLQDVNKDVYYCSEPETWGLSYDDGPNCSHNAFYNFLQEKDLKATMFYIGSNVLDWPYGAMRGIRDGHHIADHTWSHQPMTTLNNDEVLAEFYYSMKAIHLATGVTPRYWRPPYGDVDDRVRWVATQLGLTTVVWSLDTDDWAAGLTETLAQVQGNYDAFIDMGKNGTFKAGGQIVLSHEINNTTMQLAVDNLPKILDAYEHVVDVATCMNITYPYQERTVAFFPFNIAIAKNKTGDQPATAVVGTNTNGPVTATGAWVSETGKAALQASPDAAQGTKKSSAAFHIAPNAVLLVVVVMSAIFF
ncbi:hypothetical protein DFQ28_003838 [Apophysomyces sp. BC1034]|nr:hypothetical protein DFQ30_002876 [Apophysomyces sp. BC1015]KAG0182172.1 hypothetical protein DFQ29_005388 [Apophysomyces sp. BC1021]KAG0193665.1 hypothetical protein DFQ28_003838 [Apophysomyces sp. BC1034]